MEKLHFSILINATRQKVYETMIAEKTYNIWTEAFGTGSHFKGDWKTGSKILFLAPDKEGNLGGMVSRIKENRLNEYISIEHLGLISNGVEDITSEQAKTWGGGLENYTFTDKEGKTELFVDVDSAEEYAEMFNDMWHNGLQKLKELAEK